MFSRKVRYLLFTILGFTTLASQIIVLRLLMVAFSGNELTLGLALASWMIWAGLANLVAGIFSDRIRNLRGLLTISIMVLALVLPVTAAAASMIKPAIGVPTPEIVGLGTIFLATFIVLGPLCFIDGFILNLFSKTGWTESSIDIGEVYLFDAIGSALGGIVYGWIAIEYLNPLLALSLLSVVMLIGASLIVSKRLTPVAAVLILSIVVIIIYCPSLNSAITRYNWRGFNPVSTTDTKYQNLMLTENAGEQTLFSDGLPLFTIPDISTDETLANLPLLEVKGPKTVLVIGGGISGVAREINKYKVDEITCVQIDPKVTEYEREIAGSDFASNIKVVHKDGRYFLNRYDSQDKFDVIIINTGDPYSALTNRYFTEEFFRSAHAALNPEGVLFFGVYNTTNYISNDVLDFLTTIYNTLKLAFPDVVIIPFDKYYFIASPAEGLITDNRDELLKRLKERGIKTETFASETLAGTFQQRIDETDELIHKNSLRVKRLNTDSRPIGYFYGLTIWGEKLGIGTERLFKLISAIRYQWMIAFIIVSGIVLFFISKHSASLSVFLALFAAGWMGITLELLILIKYQVEVGMLFYHVGFIITSFMVGLSLGALFVIRYLKAFRPTFGRLAILIFAFGVYALFALRLTSVNYMLTNLIAGLFTGAIYQTAAGTIVEKGVGRTAGIINGADYIGAAAGSLISSAILIPLFGFNITVVITVLILFTALLTVTSRLIHK